MIEREIFEALEAAGATPEFCVEFIKAYSTAKDRKYQAAREVKRAADRERLRVKRQKNAAPSELDLFVDVPAKVESLESPRHGESLRQEEQTKVPPHPPITTSQEDDDADDAGARELGLISQEANLIADEVAVASGIDPKFLPPAWCGAAYRVQRWLDAGLGREVILIGVRTAMARKRDGPPFSISYFERPIAAAKAELGKPVALAEPATGPPRPRFETARDRRASSISQSLAKLDMYVDEENAGSGSGENIVPFLPAAGRG